MVMEERKKKILELIKQDKKKEELEKQEKKKEQFLVETARKEEGTELFFPNNPTLPAPDFLRQPLPDAHRFFFEKKS